MSVRKAKNSKYEDSSHDALKPCFQINPDVQLKEVPTTGEEYLLKVMQERQNYAETTRCNKDILKFAKYQNSFVEEEPEIGVNEKLKPTIEWQNIQVADFSDVRARIARLKAEKKNNVKKLGQELQTLREWKRFFDSTEPTLSCVLGLKSVLVDGGIEMITKMLDKVPPGSSIDYRTGQWIYSLLACVRHPLLSETACVIRGLAKKCRKIRSHINADDENAADAVAPLNIFICIVGRYFEERDLADRNTNISCLQSISTEKPITLFDE